MKRREEIKQKALSKYPQGTNRYNKFIEGAEWADKTMIEKACEWLKSNADWNDEWDDLGRNPNYGMMEEFRKAMEE